MYMYVPSEREGGATERGEGEREGREGGREKEGKRVSDSIIYLILIIDGLHYRPPSLHQ